MIKPLSEKVVVKRAEALKKTEGGLFVPGTAQEAPAEGEVIAVGTGKVLDDGTILPMELKMGDMVLFNKFGGVDIKLEGEELIILHQQEVLAILE